MPDKIRHLPQDLINQIAAGEVVERPASVLKELIENSIDAESTHIVIKVEKGGTRLISVADNGTGMSGRDAGIAFERHATSKLGSADDLFNINTLGFRGEALASIASVARVSLKTRERSAATGTCVEIEGGSIIKSTECGCPPGTEIEVSDIFYNVPARRNFLKRVSTEHGHILSTVIHQALSHRNIHFMLTDVEKGNKTLLDLPSVDSIEDRVLQIYGSDMTDSLAPFSCETDGGSIYGLVSSPVLTFRSKENQLFFVNKRAIRNPSLSHAVQEAYHDLIPRENYPVVVLFIDLDPALVDVNVHPTKREVRFKDSRYIHDMVVEAIRSSLQAKGRGNQADITTINGATTAVGWAPPTGIAWDGGQCPPYAGLSGEKLIVSEGFNPFLEKTDYHTQDMYAEPLVRILGQISALFIIAEINGELNIIDQHAAHERVIYDRLKRGYAKGTVEAQTLLIPETIELSLDKAHTLNEFKEFLNNIGFDISEIGERSFILRSIPVVFTGDDFKSLLINMIDEIKEKDLSPLRGIKLTVIDEVVKALLSRRACHTAVRAKGLLTAGETTSLVTDLLHTDMPYTCPHGRP
ncbi:MAG: DNA mismatch repair endonuclease MutL, partial [Nitrospirota bacterium]